MNNDPSLCPLCSSSAVNAFHRDKARNYLRCPVCKLVFVPARFHLESAGQQAQYDLHQNHPHDAGYRKFLARLADPLAGRLLPASEGLDFGCGPGPTLSVMLEELGHRVALYDIFYAQNREALAGAYDFITATEVVEHLAFPGEELERLWSLLIAGGWLALMTKRVTSRDAFENWHYKLDPTHISFFSIDTFEWLGKRWGATPEFIGDDVVFFQKISPAD